MRVHPPAGARIGLLLAVALLVGIVACGGNGDETAATTTTKVEPTEPTTSSTDAPADRTQVRAYFLRDEKVQPVAREATGVEVAAGAMAGLLSGPTTAEGDIGLSTSIPDGTRVRGVVVEDRIATVDLSEGFASGGGSASMRARVAQVVFTLTQFPTVDAVTFEIDGEPLTVLGGEGLILDHPQRRSDWEELSPAILVESPLPFAAVTSPLRISGTANTFEAAFLVNVTDGEGLVVYDEPAMATSGTGTRGTFDITATFPIPRPGSGTVIVFEASAKDGSRINIVELPVRISA
jgi:hypothetical protein